jgi:DNA-binding transcriptional LysR family regulator
MRALNDLQLFVSAVEGGSLSAAARHLDLTPAAASAALKRLEADLGVPLLLRSTRRQRLTPQGELFLAHARQALESLAAARASLHSTQESVQGTLQVSMPSDLGRHVLRREFDAFLAAHPQLKLRLQVSDRLADVYRQPVDVVIRYGLPPDSNLVALPLVPDNRRVLVASPDYLARHGAPSTPQALSQHHILCYMLADDVHDQWQFTSPQGVPLQVRVQGRRVADDGELVRAWALEGQGIAYKSSLDVADDLRAGRLLPLCRDWQTEVSPLNLLCADRRQLSPAVRLLHAHLQPRLQAHLQSAKETC